MLANKVVEWTRNYLNSFGGNTKAVIGVSGGKDSTVALKILIEAVGKDRIFAVTMPHKDNGVVQEVYDISKEFQIDIHEIPITAVYTSLNRELEYTAAYYNDDGIIKTTDCFNEIYTSNTPARLRMVMLYGIAALIKDARVVCTSNKSEDYIGWATKFGDMAGDFAPLADLTVREVKQLGYELGISEHLIEKKPDDGMCGLTDEEKFGFTYEELDDFLLDTKPVLEDTYQKIKKMHLYSRHKFIEMPKFCK